MVKITYGDTHAHIKAQLRWSSVVNAVINIKELMIKFYNIQLDQYAHEVY